MPTFNVDTSPLQLTQSITQSASIQNLGPGTIYLGPDSSTSALSFGALLSPGSSVNWPANTPVWVVSDASARIGVMYGATGASVGTVNATVKGPLQISDILSPVSVQGGSELLFWGYTNILSTFTSWSYTIPELSPSGLKYSGLKILLTIQDAVNPVQISYQVMDTSLFQEGYTGTLEANFHGIGSADLFYSKATSFTIPNNFPYGNSPVELLINVLNPTTAVFPVAIGVQIYGVSSAEASPVTDLSQHLASGYQPCAAATSTTPFQVPVSFEPYTLDFLLNGSATSIVITEDIYTTPDLPPATVIVNQLYNLQAVNGHVYVSTRGSGFSTSIYAVGLSGSLSVAMSKAPAPPNFNVLNYYPVGSIYLTVNPANPSTIFGGTWAAWGTGRVPVGVDVSNPVFNTVEETGGEQTHLLTIPETPSHWHPVGHSSTSNSAATNLDGAIYGTGPATGTFGFNPDTVGTGTFYPFATGAVGGGGAHNNLQPYITAYMWKRTA